MSNLIQSAQQQQQQQQSQQHMGKPSMPSINNPFEVRNFLNNHGPEAICETAARLLFMCVRWAKSIPAFVNLEMSDQIALLEDGWREIFILSAAQFQMPLDIAPLMANAGLTPDSVEPERLIRVMNELSHFQDIIAKFKLAQVDSTEFACLKAVTLFKTSKFSIFISIKLIFFTGSFCPR
jgi:nuclear receptor subfamily 2 group E protein 1